MTKVLGKGLNALIKNYAVEDVDNQVNVLTRYIILNKHQPRKTFNNDKMQSLINSIKVKGIMQPLTVRKINAMKFELIAGERRLRAAKKLGLKNVPVFILDINHDSEMMEYALIENIQRVNLNPIEEAEGYKVLKNTYKYTQSQIAKNVAKSRSEIANKLRLLNLPNNIKKSLRNNEIHYAHARLLLSTKNKKIMASIFKAIIQKKLTAREAEFIVKKYNKPMTRKKHSKTFSFLEEQTLLEKKLNTNVIIKSLNGESGILKIKFRTKKILKKLLNIIFNN